MYPTGRAEATIGAAFHKGADFLSKIAKAEDLGNLADSIRTSRDIITDTLAKVELEPDPEKRSLMFQEGMDKARQTRPDEYFTGKEFDRQINAYEPGWRYHFNQTDSSLRLATAKDKYSQLDWDALTHPEAVTSQVLYAQNQDYKLEAGLITVPEHQKLVEDWQAARTIATAEMKYSQIAGDLGGFLQAGAVGEDLPSALAAASAEIENSLLKLPAGLSDEQARKRDGIMSDFRSLRAGLAGKVKAAAEAREDAVTNKLMDAIDAGKMPDPGPIGQARSAGLISFERSEQLRRIQERAVEPAFDPITYLQGRKMVHAVAEGTATATELQNFSLRARVDGKLKNEDYKGFINDSISEEEKRDVYWLRKAESYFDAVFTPEKTGLRAAASPFGEPSAVMSDADIMKAQMNIAECLMDLDKQRRFAATAGNPLIGESILAKAVEIARPKVTEQAALRISPERIRALTSWTAEPPPELSDVWTQLTQEDKVWVWQFITSPQSSGDPDLMKKVREKALLNIERRRQ